MRAFIAVEIEEGLKEKISRLQKKLEEFSDIKLVEKENLHFCLKFLGEIDKGKPDSFPISTCQRKISQDFSMPSKLLCNFVGSKSADKLQAHEGNNVEERKIGEIKECMDIAAKEFEKFEIDLNGIGAFPSLNYVKVAWIGVREGKETLIGIAERIGQLLEQTGFEKEKREFIPHLTLGRVKNTKDKEAFRKLILDNKNIEIGKTGISRIVLFKSVLEDEGPVYEKTYEVELGG